MLFCSEDVTSSKGCLEIKEEDYPECPEEQTITFNDFGQPVCACDGGTYLLSPDQPKLPGKECYAVEDKGPCEANQTLLLDEDKIRLLCKAEAEDLVPLTAADSFASAKCPAGQVYSFKRCQPGLKRRRGKSLENVAE